MWAHEICKSLDCVSIYAPCHLFWNWILYGDTNKSSPKTPMLRSFSCSSISLKIFSLVKSVVITFTLCPVASPVNNEKTKIVHRLPGSAAYQQISYILGSKENKTSTKIPISLATWSSFALVLLMTTMFIPRWASWDAIAIVEKYIWKHNYTAKSSKCASKEQ